ncbi:hypothetical protein [Deinococcus marmoris]|uniref:hypothetical protein n=1 Tax=Deinococcus marmoris TaxID=249408 RepID=UPI0012DCC7E2|nr:hypothetical protein [Deinococcus marmoris]
MDAALGIMTVKEEERLVVRPRLATDASLTSGGTFLLDLVNGNPDCIDEQEKHGEQKWQI